MCGIYCCVSLKNFKLKDIDSGVQMLLRRRGPDQDNAIKEFEHKHCNFLFFACVLHMRGSSVTSQPSESPCRNILLFTGEIFAGLQIEKDISDTSTLLESLDRCSSIDEVANALARIEGPWSIIYFQRKENRLWFARDYFGRRSLLLSSSESQLTISSVSKIPQSSTCTWVEVPTGIHYINLTNNFINEIHSIPWCSVVNERPKTVASNLDFSKLKEHPNLYSPIANYMTAPSQTSVELSLNPVVNQDPLSQLVQACDDKNLWSNCRKLVEILKKSVARRTQTLGSWKGESKIGVLFSGGVDCTVLVCLAHQVLPIDEPIDLLNVAFEQANQEKFQVPDRITGINSFKELLTLCPNRRLNFIEINVAIAELKRLRAERIAHLTYPKQTVLDDSIGCALWFASRGEGVISGENNSVTDYRSTARILLCGMGADEQLGGYSRHRSVFQRAKDWSAVDNEMKMEIDRISSRNLGRDDRIISDHGREALFPYLDEEVVGFLLSLPVDKKTDFRFPRGIGEKILLRGAAYLLGLREAAVLPKRAIQFGSRIAKVEAGREKGSDTCSRLTAGVVK